MRVAHRHQREAIGGGLIAKIVANAFVLRAGASGKGDQGTEKRCWEPHIKMGATLWHKGEGQSLGLALEVSAQA
jgi:hypothetical protein